MSYYYDYYIGYELDNEIYCLGPYNNFGELKPVLSLSRNGASDLHLRFYPLKEEQMSDDLKKDFSYEDYDGNNTVRELKYLPIKDLPSDSFVKQGYFLIDDVKRYEVDSSYFDGFYDKISPAVYNAMVEHEIKFGPKGIQKDSEGYEYQPYNASDYMFYMYPDYHSEEYESCIIREAAESLMSYNNLGFNAKLFVLETEG